MKHQQVLYIDDDEDDQELFQMAVSQINNDIKCISAFNAREALQKLVSREWEPDVIFLDLNMPVMTGQQFLEESSKRIELNAIPVIILSTSSRSDTKLLLKNMGAQDFLTKPRSFTELVQILEPLLK